MPYHRRLEVLVVDDEAMVAMALEAFLLSIGHRPTSYPNGVEALAALNNKGFHAAVIDLGMLDMNGWEVTRQINRLRPDIAVILASGRMVTADESRAMEVRVSAILIKPFGQLQLMAALDGAVGSGPVGWYRDR
ncbi:MAG: response regulator [Chloroflexi bacterium]|nr:response regulator [Chloroflexota bacterium]